MKNPKITLTKDGLLLIDEPEKPSSEGISAEFVSSYYSALKFTEYEQALKQAIKEGVKFKEAIDPILIWNIGRIEQGKLYDIPNGYRVNLKTDHQHEECKLECICTYADDYYVVLEPLTKQEPENDPLFELAMEAVEFGGKKSGDDNPVLEKGEGKICGQTCGCKDSSECQFSTPVIEQKEYINSIRENFEMWKDGKLNNGIFNWHLERNLLELEKLAESKLLTPQVTDGLPIDFVLWYSGMSKEQILKAYQRFLRENDYSNPPSNDR